MKIKSALITQWSGSVGGLVGAHNQGGLYIRARTIPTNPSTLPQETVRNAMLTLASRWQTVLTAAQRAAWTTYANNVKIIDRLGEARTIVPIAMYQRSNVVRIQTGLSIVDDGPTVFSLPTFTPPTMVVTAADPATAAVTFTAADEWANETGGAMIVYLSREQSPSKVFFKGPYRYAGSILGDPTTPPTSPATITSKFAATADNQVFAQIRVARADGRLSSTFRLVGTAS